MIDCDNLKGGERHPRPRRRQPAAAADRQRGPGRAARHRRAGALRRRRIHRAAARDARRKARSTSPSASASPSARGRSPLNGQNVFASVSIGFASYPEDGRTLDALAARADRALYQREAGRPQPRRALPAGQLEPLLQRFSQYSPVSLMPKSGVRLVLLTSLKPRLAVDCARRGEIGLRPQHELAIALRARERDAFLAPAAGPGRRPRARGSTISSRSLATRLRLLAPRTRSRPARRRARRSSSGSRLVVEFVDEFARRSRRPAPRSARPSRIPRA